MLHITAWHATSHKTHETNNCVLTKKKHLRNLSVNTESSSDDNIYFPRSWIPRANICYTYSEDINILNRIHSCISHKDQGEPEYVGPTAEDRDPYSESKAQEKYLNSNPVCLLILGKQNVGQTNLAKALAEYWKCVYIDPETILQDEIKSNSSAGRCIDFNLRLGRGISTDIILKLVKKRVNSLTARHRGFLITGLPLVPNGLFKVDSPIVTESAVFNADCVLDELVVRTLEIGKEPVVAPSKVAFDVNGDEAEGERSEAATKSEGVENDEEEDAKEADEKTEFSSPEGIKEQVDLGSVTSEYQEIGGEPLFNVDTSLENQLDTIFQFFEMPFIIIYIMSSKEDTLLKRNGLRFNIHTKHVISLKDIVRKDFNTDYGHTVSEKDFQQNDVKLIDENHIKHLVQRPIDLMDSVSVEVDNYKDYILPVVDRYIMRHDQQYVVKIDGRMPPSRMFHTVTTKLRTLPLQRVVLPERLIDVQNLENRNKDVDDEEDEDEDAKGFTLQGSTPEECFPQLRKLKSIEPQFPWQLSQWAYKCPVALKNGRLKIGDPKLAVKFMNNIYFLSDEASLLKFCRNPRPYLLPVEPQPTGRVFIFGPARSGKSTVAQCLGFMLNSSVVKLDDLIENAKLNKIESYQMDAASVEVDRMISVVDGQSAEFEGEFTEHIPEPFEVQLSDDDICNLLIDSLRDIESHNCGGWIVDAMPYSVNIWRKLYDADCFADDIIFLTDSDPENKFLIEQFTENKYQRFRFFKDFFKYIGLHEIAARSPSIDTTLSEKIEFVSSLLNTVFESDEMPYNQEVGGEGDDLYGIGECEDDPAKEAALLSIGKYVSLLKNFNENYPEIESFISEVNLIPLQVDVNEKTVAQILEQAVNRIEDKYRLGAFEMSEEEKQEMLNLTTPNNLDEEAELDEETASKPAVDNRKLGDTNIYCPIALHNHRVLWQGKDEYSLKFDNKMYLFCNQNAKDEFMNKPYNFVPYLHPPAIYPPVRICVAGPLGSGKTTFSKKLADLWGLCYIDSFEMISQYISRDKYIESRKDVCTRLFRENNADTNYNSQASAFVYDYLKNGTTLPKDLFKMAFEQLWLNEPFITSGFVLDGFPRHFNDLENIKEEFLIPSVVVEMKVDLEQVQERIYMQYFDECKTILKEKQQEAERRFEISLEYWKTERDEKFELLMAQKCQEHYLNWLSNLEQENEMNEDNLNGLVMGDENKIDPFAEGAMPAIHELEETESIENEGDYYFPLQRTSYVYDSIQEEIDMEEVNQILDELMPKPELVPLKETEDTVAEKLTVEISEQFDRDMEGLMNLRSFLEEEKIPYHEFFNDKLFHSPFLEARYVLDKYKFSNKSTYERIFNISMEEAEQLLDAGYYFLSRFGRTCPVQIFENEILMQMFLPLEQKELIFPIIHRQYIFFLAGMENKRKFEDDPLKYVCQNNCPFPLFPLRIAIIGPPKCGKSCLANRISKELGLKVITRGEAIRYVLRELPDSYLAHTIDGILRSGWLLTDHYVFKAVESFGLDSKGITQGVVFDGFPVSKSEILELEAVGLLPFLIMDLEANTDFIHLCLSTENQTRTHIPVFSHEFLDNRFAKWAANEELFRIWTQQNYYNLVKVPYEFTKWALWTECKHLIFDVFNEIVSYIYMFKSNQASPLEHMCVTQEEFLDHRSRYFNYCPCCLQLEQALEQTTMPPDRRGLIQYNEYYYWVCKKHYAKFYKNPKYFIPPFNSSKLPIDLPRTLQINDVSEAPMLFQKGYCIVTFWDNLPRRRLVMGLSHFAVLYRGQTFLFDTAKCLKKFMKYPSKYANKTINFMNSIPTDPPICEGLPTLGFLQQHHAKILTDASMNAHIMRPKYPCLDPFVSAAINIGLFLKIHHEKTPPEAVELYRHASKMFVEKCRIIASSASLFRKLLNPYIEMPELRTHDEEKYQTEASASAIDSQLDASGDNSSLSLSTPSSVTYMDRRYVGEGLKNKGGGEM